jgi:hypothetical protein
MPATAKFETSALMRRVDEAISIPAAVRRWSARASEVNEAMVRDEY